MSMDPYGLSPEQIAELIGQQYNPYQGYPLKQVSDQAWDFYGPTPDYLIAQQFGAMTPWADDFSTDAFFQAEPVVRGGLAQALAETDGDTIGAYNYLQGDEYQKMLADQVGRTEWDQLRGQGDLASIGALTNDERESAAIDYYNRALENVLAGGAPTSARNQAQWDQIAQRMGGRTYPGAGEIVGQGAQGAGFQQGGGSDPMAELAGQGVDLSATPDPTPFGEGIQMVGEADRAQGNRLFNDQGARYADIDGVRYQLPDTMEDQYGRNPYYLRQLQSVMTDRRRREFDASDEGREARERRSGSSSSGRKGGWREFLFGRNSPLGGRPLGGSGGRRNPYTTETFARLQREGRI